MKCVTVSEKEAEAQAGMSWLGKWRLPHLHCVRENTDPVCLAGSRLGVVLLTHVSESHAELKLMKVSFFQGQTPGSTDLAISALTSTTWLTFPVRLPLLGLSCQVPGWLLPVLQAVHSCTQSAAHFPVFTLLCRGVFLHG